MVKITLRHFCRNLFQKLKCKFLWEYIVLTIVTLFIYQFGFHNEFTNWDNPFQFPGNRFDHPLSLERLYHIFTDFTDILYQPLPAVVFHIFNAIDPGEPLYFHVFSSIIHLFNGWLVFILCLILLKNRLKSFFIALLFVSHPMMVESVSWVATTSTVMFAFCFLIALIAYLKYKNKNAKRWYLLCLGMFFTGLLCKAQIAPLIFIFYALDHLRGDLSWLSKKSIKEKLPFLILICLFYYINLYSRENESVINIETFQGKGIKENSEFYFMIPYQYFWYVVKLLFPYNLGALYPFTKNLSLIYYLAIVALFPLLWMVASNKTKKIILFSIIFYSANIIIVTYIFTFFRSPVANRYSYVACIGFFIFVFHAFHKKYDKYIYIFFFFLVCCNIFLSVQQVKVWKNSVTLWEENLKYGSKIDSYIMLGNYYFEQKDYQKAIDNYTEVLKLNNDSKVVYGNFAKSQIKACKLALQQDCKTI